VSLFSDIPIRSNADTGLVDASWWNTIRTALIAYAGGTAALDQTQFSILGSQSTYTSIAALALNHTLTRAHVFGYTIYRDDGTVSRREVGTIRAMYKEREGTWTYAAESFGEDALGNGTIADPLIINSSGAFQYKSDDFASGTMRIETVINFAKET